ncbi:MAG: 4Fe-4S dicluster domain-containing protein [Neisseriaceae bacterium]
MQTTYPLKNNAYGGGFVYHMANNLVAVGLVTALDYKNPYLSPFYEFQKFKLHPKLKSLLSDGKRIEYGARCVVEGGIQSLPELSFPGGVIVGDSAGFLNVAKIKGVHNAIKSGILAAQSILHSILNNQSIANNYSDLVKSSWLYKDLYEVRNIRPSFRLGLHLGMLYSAFDYYVMRGNAPWTFKWNKKDNERLLHKNQCLLIDYPKPDGVTTFDRASSVHLANINHDDSQPCHLKLKSTQVPIKVNLAKFDAPETRYCPAGVYEILTHHNIPHLQINAQNCVHCKACDIKDPTQNITWVPPEAGSGPQYSDM